MVEEASKAPGQDATPAPPAQPDEGPIPPRTGQPRRVLIAGALVIAVALASLAVAAYRSGSAMRGDLARLDERIGAILAQQRELQAELATARARADAVKREVEQKVAEQESGLQSHRQMLAQQQIRLDQEREHARQQATELRESVAALHRQFGRDNVRWMVAEAEYLMQVANQRLTLAQDPLTALEALKLADRRLQETGDPGWMGVRELLAEETVALSTLRLPEVPSLAGQLAALGEQATALQPRSMATAAATAQAAAAPAAEGGAWRRVLRDGWDGFRSLVVVRRHDGPVPAMLPPDQTYFLGQTMRLQIETARLALLRGDTATYRGSLDAARQVLVTHFDPGDAAVSAATASLERLAAIELRPALPDVTRSLRALRARDQQIATLQGRQAP